MPDEQPLDEQEREELVAYLDGELDDQTAQEVEAKLGRDPAARAEADSLRQVWELLDYLPRADPSANFTHRTMDKLGAVRPSASVPAATRTPSGRGWWFAAAWAAAAVAAAVAGYAIARYSAPAAPPPP